MRLSRFLLLISVLSLAPFAESQNVKIDWIPICGKCLSPTITSRSGIGTAHAVAEGRITLQAAKDYCENWSPDADCSKEAAETLKGEAHKVYRVSADCIHGTVTDTGGSLFHYAGVWPGGFAKGRTRWRDSSGKIVQPDENGLSVSAIGDLLCPAGIGARLPQRHR